LPAPTGVRKCVVSTNIAATSLTIEGVRYRFLSFVKAVTEGRIQKVLLDLEKGI